MTPSRPVVLEGRRRLRPGLAIPLLAALACGRVSDAGAVRHDDGPGASAAAAGPSPSGASAEPVLRPRPVVDAAREAPFGPVGVDRDFCDDPREAVVLASARDRVAAIATDDTYLYVSTHDASEPGAEDPPPGAVYRVPVCGGVVERMIEAAGRRPFIVDAGPYVAFDSTPVRGRIRKSDLDAVALFDDWEPSGLVGGTATHAYFLMLDRILRIAHDGVDPEVVIDFGANVGYRAAMGPAGIAYSVDKRLAFVSLDGAAVRLLGVFDDAPRALAVSDVAVYVAVLVGCPITSQLCRGAPSRVDRLALDTGAVVEVSTGLVSPSRILAVEGGLVVVDADHFAWLGDDGGQSAVIAQVAAEDLDPGGRANFVVTRGRLYHAVGGSVVSTALPAR